MPAGQGLFMRIMRDPAKIGKALGGAFAFTTVAYYFEQASAAPVLTTNVEWRNANKSYREFQHMEAISHD